LGGFFDEAGSEGIGFDVTHQSEVVRVRLDGETFETALVEMAAAYCAMCAMPAV